MLDILGSVQSVDLQETRTAHHYYQQHESYASYQASNAIARMECAVRYSLVRTQHI